MNGIKTNTTNILSYFNIKPTDKKIRSLTHFDYFQFIFSYEICHVFFIRNIRVFSILLILLFKSSVTSIAFSQETKKVLYESPDMYFDKSIGAIRLTGDVVTFRHEGAIMKCDSAYYYQDKNSLDAFNNVYINQGDTLHLYGDYLFYDGNKRQADVRDNVKLFSEETSLFTDKLDFDFENNVGYYTTSADIKNGENDIRSEKGYYYSDSKIYHLIDSVVIINEDYTIKTDTLKYNTVSDVTYFQGPTHIVSDSNYIYCESGWYNTRTNISFLKQNTYFQGKEQSFRADSIYYERETGYGEGYSNVSIVDTVENVMLLGNYATYYEQTEKSILTDSAVFIYITDEDSVYVHADTLKSDLDTAGNKIVLAYYKVKMFKPDLQGKCDSLSYSTTDSIIRLFGEPVMWSEENQLSANYIEIHTKNKNIDKMFLNNLAFIISHEDSIYFNQIKGKKMICHFKNNQIYKIDVDGNVESVYYLTEYDDIIGVNLTTSSTVVIYFNESEMERIKYITKPEGTINPINQISIKEQTLKNFQWLEVFRPKNKNEIFLWEEKQ